MKLQFIGSGDAFGSGGRFNTCFHITGERANFLIDCGASSLIAMKKLKISRNEIQAIFITHFHADHFGGIPFFMLDSQFFSKRTEPLLLAGPPGLRGWFLRVLETAFPGSSKTKQRFELQLQELEAGRETIIGELKVTPYQVIHGMPENCFFAFRFEVENRIIAYTGDTEWTESLVPAAANADLLIAEAYFKEKSVPLHLDLATLVKYLPMINAKRVILTHMSEDMLMQRNSVDFETAEDGLTVHI